MPDLLGWLSILAEPKGMAEGTKFDTFGSIKVIAGWYIWVVYPYIKNRYYLEGSSSTCRPSGFSLDPLPSKKCLTSENKCSAYIPNMPLIKF